MKFGMPRRACGELQVPSDAIEPTLGFGVWRLVFGAWGLKVEVWGLGLGVSVLEFGIWGVQRVCIQVSIHDRDLV